MQRRTKIVATLGPASSTPQRIRELFLAAVGERMGKECVTVRESPGFVTSRINAMIGNEAFFMLQEGLASPEDIDKALKLGANHPMGPLELGDFIGLDDLMTEHPDVVDGMGEPEDRADLVAQEDDGDAEQQDERVDGVGEFHVRQPCTSGEPARRP